MRLKAEIDARLTVGKAGREDSKVLLQVPNDLVGIASLCEFLVSRYSTLFSSEIAKSSGIVVTLDGFEVLAAEPLSALRDGDTIRIAPRNAPQQQQQQKKKRKRKHKKSKSKSQQVAEEDEEEEEDGEMEVEEGEGVAIETAAVAAAPSSSKVTAGHTRKKIVFDSDGEITEEKIVEPELVVQGKRSGKKRKRSLVAPRALRPEKDILENVSVFLDSQHPPPSVPAHTIQIQPKPPQQVKRYDGLRDLRSLPQVGDVIAWRECFLSEKLVPELSDWKEATVVAVDPEAKAISFKFSDGSQFQCLAALLQTPKVISSTQPQVSQEQEKSEPARQQQPTPQPPSIVSAKQARKTTALGVGGLLAKLRREEGSTAEAPSEDKKADT